MKIKYKIRKNPFGDSSKDQIEKIGECIIPRDLGNTDYQQFLNDVRLNGLHIVEGPEVVVRGDYKEKRAEAYPPIGDQLDKIYHHGIDAWKSDIKMIKDQFPDSQVGLTTTANVPDWVQTEVDKL